MSCPTCEICGEENGFLRCREVGLLCFDCWGSGIHEVMKRTRFPRWNDVIARAQKLYRDSIHLKKTIDRLSALTSQKQEVAS